MKSITDYNSQVRSTTDYKSPKLEVSLTTNLPNEKHIVVVDLLLIVAPIVGVLCFVHVLLFSTLCPSFEIVLMGKRQMVALSFTVFLMSCD